MMREYHFGLSTMELVSTQIKKQEVSGLKACDNESEQ
jgi:hypothetical protein